jgi:hypothetical protein
VSARLSRSALAGAVLLCACAAALAGAQQGRGQSSAAAPPRPLPTLGAADPDMKLIGAAPQGAPGEAWGYRRLPLPVSAVRVGTRDLDFGPVGAGTPQPQLAFVRHTDSTGWQVFDTPVDEHGDPYRGPIPNPLGARITPKGGGVLVGRDTARPPDQQVVVLYHRAGGSWRALDAPPPDVLMPAGGGQSAEVLAEGRGAGKVAIAAVDEGTETGLFVAPGGRNATEAVLHYDGNQWRREPIEIPSGSETSFRVVSIEATGAGNAWALAEPDPSQNRSVVLLERTTTPSGPVWVERELTGTPFASADAPGQGISAARPAPGNSQLLTVTTDGAWIDLRATVGGSARSVTLYYRDSGGGAVTGSWCDADPCDFPLGLSLSEQSGYRSFAWAGPGFGSRVITNPLDPGEGDESNRGTYATLKGTEFERMPGGGANFRPSAAFAGADDGWLEGPVKVVGEAPASPLDPWPVSLRAPLTDVTPAPGSTPGSLDAKALAVGADGSVARYEPGRGWVREFLFTAVGAVNRSTLRGVAWPTANRAHAVGDLGAMWIWNADDNLWVADPGAPIGFEGNLLDVAFDPDHPDRGYAVGRRGVLLEYGKSWEQAQLPSGFGSTDFTSIAFAGSQAIVAAGRTLLANSGGGWHEDQSATDLLANAPGEAQLFSVAALPDGGAVAAGRDIVIERDGPSSPWRYADQPIPGQTAIAAAAIRPSGGGRVRAVLSVVPQINYPTADDLPDPDPNVPPPIPPPYPIAGDGYLLRETGSGWEDLQRTAFGGSSADRPLKSDPVLSFLLGPNGQGWAVGGWSGHADAAGRGTSAGGSTGTSIRNRVRTAMIGRFGGGAAPQAATGSSIPLPAGPARFAVAGHAQCEAPCADLAPEGVGPDRTLTATLNRVADLGAQPGGPRALLYTGNRVETGLRASDAARYASLLGAQPELPVYPALGSSDVSGGSGASAFQSAFSGFPAPFGSGPSPSGIQISGIPGAPAGAGARTHYAFDTTGPGGRVRVIVIDNSAGSLAASDPYQNPAEPQLPWLVEVLGDARQEGVPAVVMGNRGLNPNFTPKLNVATDGDQVAQVLAQGGASAYLFDRPEENRTMRIPAGAADTIPSFGTGTLGYRSPVAGVVGADRPDALFGSPGFMLLEVDGAGRDPQTNRAPVSVRQIPVLSDLALEATDGILLRRSRPALFRGLGRRPEGGDRWGRPSAGSGSPDPAGGDPYTLFPPDPCLVAGCSARINPEYRFTSADPDIADFVRQDPASTNLRKPFIDGNDKVVTDNTSGLLCPFNPGTTTVSISAGGLSFSQQVTVLSGSVLRPCGTRPLDPSRFKTANPAVPPPPPTAVGNAVPGPVPPPPPGLPPVAAPPAQTPLLAVALLPPPVEPTVQLPVSPLPPPAPVGRPIPPGGAPARVYQIEEEREEELAPEESHAFARLEGNEGGGFPAAQVLLLVGAAALTGASLRGGGGARRRVTAAPAYTHQTWTIRRTYR